MKKIFFSMAIMAVAATSVQAAENSLLITDSDSIVANGVKKLYSRASEAYFPMELPTNPIPVAPAISDLASTIVFSQDGKYAYIKNPFSCKAVGTYMYGEVRNDSIIVNLPQLIYIEKGEDFEKDSYVYKYIKMTDQDGDYFEVDPENTPLVYTIGKDGVIKMADRQAIRMVVDDVFGQSMLTPMGYADAAQVFTPVTNDGVVPPEGLKTEQWGFMHGPGVGHYINVGFDGNDVYVQGIAGYNQPYSWVKGTLKDGQITFADGQFLGMSSIEDHFLYFKTVTAPFVKNPYFQFYDLSQSKPTDGITFNYDAAAKTMKIAEPANDSIEHIVYISWQKDYLDMESEYRCWRKFENPNMEFRGPVTETITPADPINVKLDDSQFKTSGYYTLWFNIPRKTSTGDFMNLKDAFYNIFIDDELFTVYPDQYIRAPKEITNIPYWYDEGYDIQTGGNDQVLFYIYSRGYEKAGVRCGYRNADGNISYTKIVYSQPVGINDVISDSAVTSETFYDIAGREVENPSTGMYIQVSRHADGTISTQKIIRK